jgi:hypothetical protein
VSCTPLVVVLALVATRAVAPDDTAARDSVLVDASRCTSIDATEVQRLLALELVAVTQEIRVGPPLSVDLACPDATLTIEVSDPLTGKRLERDLPMPAADEGRERVIALAIAQLFAASWLELLLPSEPDTDTPPPKPDPGTGKPAVEAARKHVEPLVQGPERRIEIVAGLGGRGHSLESTPWGIGVGEVDVRGWFGAVAVLGRITALGGAAQRELGEVRSVAVLAGLGVGFRVPTRGRWRFGGAVVVSAGWARLRAVSERADVPSGSTQSATGALGLGMGPRVLLGRSRRVVLELDAEIGGMLRAPEGLVDDDRAVTLGGLWAGGMFRVAVDLRRRRRSA